MYSTQLSLALNYAFESILNYIIFIANAELGLIKAYTTTHSWLSVTNAPVGYQEVAGHAHEWLTTPFVIVSGDLTCTDLITQPELRQI